MENKTGGSLRIETLRRQACFSRPNDEHGFRGNLLLMEVCQTPHYHNNENWPGFSADCYIRNYHWARVPSESH